MLIELTGSVSQGDLLREQFQSGTYLSILSSRTGIARHRAFPTCKFFPSRQRIIDYPFDTKEPKGRSSGAGRTRGWPIEETTID